MNNEELNFMTMGDEGFSNTIICCAKRINKIYPDSNIYIYDWGLSDRSISILSEINNTKLINWKNKSNFSLGTLEKIKLNLEENISENVYLDHLYSELVGGNYPLKDLKKDFYMCQKPQCILDCADRVNKNLFFIDGDAIVINDLDGLFDLDFDIGVTLRPKIETALKKREGKERFLNAGIIFFKSKSEFIKEFVNLWIDEIESKDPFGLREQRSLTHLIQRADPAITDDYYYSGNIYSNGNRINIKALPCEKYNYYWINNGFDVNSQKILHFKDGLHNDPIFIDVIDSIEKDDIRKWGQKIEG